MHRVSRLLLSLALIFAGPTAVYATEAAFTPRELFRIPFGKGRDTLGAHIDGGNFLFPRDFTMDGAGHFYIYDSNNHRIARFSSGGKYEMGFGYPSTARQIFAHADSRQNLWLLVSDPARGMYYGVYAPNGKRLRPGIFSQFNHFRLHPDDDYTLHVILSSEANPAFTQTFLFDEQSLLMKKENIARPPENHHQVRASEHVYFIDQVPNGSKEDAGQVNRITDDRHHGVADIRGAVIYVTAQGEVYTRMGEREIEVYGVDGSLKGKVLLEGLSSACASIRFDAAGNLYELDGIPDAAGQYDARMPGMRMMEWERR